MQPAPTHPPLRPFETPPRRPLEFYTESIPSQDSLEQSGQIQRVGSPYRGQSELEKSARRFNFKYLLFGKSASSQPSSSMLVRRNGSTAGEITRRSQLSLPTPAARPSRAMTRPNLIRPADEVRQLAPNRVTPLRSRSARSTSRRIAASSPTAVGASSTSASSPKRQRQAPRRPRKPASPAIYLSRLLILGIGVGAIAGTILSVWDPSTRLSSGSLPSTQAGVAHAESTQPNYLGISRDLVPGDSTAVQPALPIGPEMTALATTVRGLTAQSPGLTPGVFIADLDTGAYLNLNGTSMFSAASMIKVPILVAFFQDVDAGKIRLDEELTMRQEEVAEGSGDMQYQPVGTRYTALETATKMIVISDNTATNMLINRLGGIDALNQRFKSWGSSATTIRNLLPDLEGTNVTTPKELADLMARVVQGDFLSLRSRDRVIQIMQGTVTNTLLPSGLGEGSTIAHKTGDIGSMVGDVGIIDMPNGKRYVATVMVQRSHNDPRAQELIRQISQTAYQALNQPATGVNPASNPAGNPGLGAPQQPTPPTELPTGGQQQMAPVAPTAPPAAPNPQPFVF